MEKILPRKDTNDRMIRCGSVAVSWQKLDTTTLLSPGDGYTTGQTHWLDFARGHQHGLNDIETKLWLSTRRTDTQFAAGMCFKLPSPSAKTAVETLEAAFEDIEERDSAVQPLAELLGLHPSSGYHFEAHQHLGLMQNHASVWMTGETDIEPTSTPSTDELLAAHQVFATVLFAATVLSADIAAKRRKSRLTVNLAPINRQPTIAERYANRPPSRIDSRFTTFLQQ